MRSISVIVPTWQEQPLIADAVGWARRLGDEVIVVDGGSSDGTVASARDAGAAVIVTGKGRGPQLHAGACSARGDILLFLHADARLPPSARGAILEALSDPGVIGGNFLIRFLPESWFTSRLVPLNDLRRRVTKRYYGDSAIFIRRSAYDHLGGFPPFPLMEDYAFSARMERAARCAYIRHVPVHASARRFRGRELRTVARWMTIQILYWCRVPAWILARGYPDRRGGEPEQFIRLWRETDTGLATPRISRDRAAVESSGEMPSEP